MHNPIIVRDTAILAGEAEKDDGTVEVGGELGGDITNHDGDADPEVASSVVAAELQ